MFRPSSRWLSLASITLLTACSVSKPPPGKTAYDLGPVPVQTAPATATAPAQPLTLDEVRTTQALDNTAIQYRLTYANAQELRPYTLARWSMPPAQMLHQRVREAWSAHGPVLSPGDSAPEYTLRVELDEFVQQFEAPGASQGVVRLIATLFKGGKLQAQTRISARAPATSADAAGGVSALVQATDDAVAQLMAWTIQQQR